MTTNTNTLDPNEIRRLPVDRSKPLNGLSREQVLAIGEDPQQVEAARLAHNAWAGQKQREEILQAVAAAKLAVEQGELTSAEAAEALRAAGNHEALNAFVTLWQQEERDYAAQEAAEAIPFLTADDYAAIENERRKQELTAAEAEAEQIREQLRRQQVNELQSDLKATLGGHALEPQVGQHLVAKLQASGVLPSTEQERATVIEEAIRETAVLGDALQSITEQARAEFRALHKGGRDGLNTRAEIAHAERAYVEPRINQLAEQRVIELESLKAAPSAAEESAALTERYAKRQNFARQAGEMFKRGAEADARRDRGEGISEEKDAYREAMARAEAEARNVEIRSGYGANAVQEVKNPGLPAGYVDEYGPGGYS